jgi:molecular chaperone DnaJ
MPRRGADRTVQVKISFDQAVKGTKVDIPLSYVDNCPECHGTGAKTPNDVETCKTCGGRGRVRMRRQTLFGMMESEEECPDCHGTGKTIKRKCDHCHGAGRVQVNETITVNIPHGVDTGNKIRISGKGEPGVNNGPSGDLIIQIQVAPSQTFVRKEADVYINAPISYTDALLGGTITVPTVTGDCDLVIPPCTNPGTILKMSGKGITTPNGKTGNQYVTINVKFPKSLNSEQKELVKKLDDIESSKGSFFGLFRKKK